MSRFDPAYPNTAHVWSAGDYSDALRRGLEARGLKCEKERVLYIGGGTGRSLPELMRLFGTTNMQVFFVEPIAASIEHAQKRLCDQGLSDSNIKWLNMSIQEFLEEESESEFTLVLALLVFHYLNADWPSILSEVAARLVFNGGLIFDELIGGDHPSTERLHVIDQETNVGHASDDKTVRRIVDHFRTRTHRHGVAWNVPLKATNMSVLTQACPVYGFKLRLCDEPVARRVVELSSEHLPWAWGSVNASSEIPIAVDGVWNKLNVAERWWTWHKCDPCTSVTTAEEVSRKLAWNASNRALSFVMSVEDNAIQEAMPRKVLPRLALGATLNSGLVGRASTLGSAFLISSANALLKDAHSLDDFLLFVRQDASCDLLQHWMLHLRFFVSKRISSIATQLLGINEAICVAIDGCLDVSLELSAIKCFLVSGGIKSFDAPVTLDRSNIRKFIQWECLVESSEELTKRFSNDATANEFSEIYSECRDAVGVSPSVTGLDELRYLSPLLHAAGSLVLFPMPGAWSLKEERWTPENFLLFGVSYKTLSRDNVSEAIRLRDCLAEATRRLDDQLFYSRWRTRFLKQSRAASVAAIASQSLSHNIGSHALSDARLFDAKVASDSPSLKDFHQYLQGRLDYVAQLISKTAQPEPMYLWRDVLCEFFRQRLLLNRLVADRSVEGSNLSFKVTFPEEGTGGSAGKEITVSWAEIEKWLGVNGKGDERTLVSPGADVLVAIPGGAVGRHALYSILENLMRNSVKYGLRRKEQQNNLCIHFRLRNSGSLGTPFGEACDYWLLEIWDNFSGFPPNDPRYGKLAKDFIDDVIDEEGKPRTSGHGLIEIKEAMRFLHGHDDNSDGNGKGSPYACVPDCHRTSPAHKGAKCKTGVCHYDEDHCCNANVANVFDEQYGGRKPDKAKPNGKGEGVLVYRVRLRRPRLLGVWCPRVEFDELRAQDVAQGVFFRKNLLTPGPGDTPSLADLAPHLLVIRDDPSLQETADAEQEMSIGRICGVLAEQHWQLPYRLLVVTTDDGRKKSWRMEIENRVLGGVKNPLVAGKAPQGGFLPYNRVRVISDAACHAALSDPCGCAKDLALVNKVYDTWLRAYKPIPDGKPWHLIICFERGEEVINDRWKPELLMAFHDKAENLNREPWAVCSVFHKTKSSDTFAATCSGIDYRNANGNAATPPPAATVIHFGNHGSEPPELKGAWDGGELHFTQAFGSAHGPRTFYHLYSPPQEAQALRFYLYSIMEAALTKVLIFDERVFSSVFTDSPPTGQGHEISLARVSDAWGSGVLPALQIPSGTRKCARARRDVWIEIAEEAQSFYLPASNTAKTSLRWASLEIGNVKDARATMLAAASGHKAVYADEEEPKVSADIIALHEGLVEELVSHSIFAKGTDLGLLAIAPRILRFSGKGPEARKLDPRHPFAEYSAISACVTPYNVRNSDQPEREALRIEKVALGSAVLNAIGTPPSTLQRL